MVTAYRYVAGIGSRSTRARLTTRIGRCGERAANVTHPGVYAGSQSYMGSDSVVCRGVQSSRSARLGEYVNVNPGAVNGNHAVLGSFISINPGANVSVETRVGVMLPIVASAVVLRNIEIGRSALVGACACLTLSMPPGLGAKGVLAKC